MNNHRFHRWKGLLTIAFTTLEESNACRSKSSITARPAALRGCDWEAHSFYFRTLHVRLFMVQSLCDFRLHIIITSYTLMPTTTTANATKNTVQHVTVDDYGQRTRDLIDELKAICAAFGLGNDGNEFKIITQLFLYKFLNDKFAYEVKKIRPAVAAAGEKWAEELRKLSAEEYNFLLLELDESTAKLQPYHFLDTLFHLQNETAIPKLNSKEIPKPTYTFHKYFDDVLRDVAIANNDIFSVKTDDEKGSSRIIMFNELSRYIANENKRDEFCTAVVNKLVQFSFEQIFDETYDFYSTTFEYLIKDYNKDSGGKYAEYYTPRAVAKIMAAILVPAATQVQDMTCFDPAAGSGQLLMSLAHAIGTDRCTIYSQDISQKSSSLLRLNLILNNLVHSIQNIVQGNTIKEPFHREHGSLQRFDYVVSNPPFKLDFSDFRDDLDEEANNDRFFAGLPNVPKKAKDKMAIYQLFIQHIMHVLAPTGKAAIVVPTGFVTAQSGIDKRIRKKLVEKKWLAGVVSMPSNIFATTGTNVSILFLDKQNKGEVVLMDASGLGETVKEGKNQKTVLTEQEEQRIIDVFIKKEKVEELTAIVTYDEIEQKNYSLSAGQYFDVKIEYEDITATNFNERVAEYQEKLDEMFKKGKILEEQIFSNIKKMNFE